jgi:hypothetical protein
MRSIQKKVILCVTLTAVCVSLGMAFARSEATANNKAEKTWTLQEAATMTWAKNIRPDRWTSEFIPLNYWHEAIRELDPLYVYYHKDCIAVVLKRSKTIEEGLYIPTVLNSSVILIGKEIEGFTFTQTDNGYYRFVRNRPTVQPDPQSHHTAAQSLLENPAHSRWEHAEWRDYPSEGKSVWITGKESVTKTDTYELYRQLGGKESIEQYRIASYTTTILDQGSAAGWELCAGDCISNTNTRYYFFKRLVR